MAVMFHASYLDGPSNLNFLLLHSYTDHLIQTLISTNSGVNKIKMLYGEKISNLCFGLVFLQKTCNLFS